MKFIKVKFLKNGAPRGMAYTFRCPIGVEVVPGDIVKIDSAKHGVVVAGAIDENFVKSYGVEKIKEIIGKVEEKKNADGI